MAKTTDKYKKGESVSVKPGVKDPDFDIDIGGWQGRVLTVTPDMEQGAMIDIAWDSLTLKQMPDEVFEQAEVADLDYTQMRLSVSDIAPAQARDTLIDVQHMIAQVHARYAWASYGEQGQRIQQVVNRINPDDEIKLMQAWADYLATHLTFPFVAVVDESSRGSALRFGDGVTVASIDIADDLYGVIAQVKFRNRRLSFQMCGLKVVDEGSANYEVLHDYCVWYANR